MLFGPIFYKKINKLSNWQQALFALAISTRLVPNFKLYCDCTENTIGFNRYSTIIDTLWNYLEHHNEKIDLLPFQDFICSVQPLVSNESTLGEIVAYDACQSLLITIDSVIHHIGNEASKVSETSINTVIRFLEQTLEHDLTDEEIVEQELIETEIDFQMAVIKILNNKRSPEMFLKLKNLSKNKGYSNIGIPLNNNEQ